MKRECGTCGMPEGSCYAICPESEAYYSPEAEREDSLYNDSLSHDAWYAAAMRQHEAVHGPEATPDEYWEADDADGPTAPYRPAIDWTLYPDDIPF